MYTQSSLMALLLATVLILLQGCASLKTTNTARTGLEQLLISNAVDQALDKVNFQPFSGRTVWLEEKYLESVDKNYISASIRHRLLRAGATLASKAEEADILLEPRSGGVGTDTSELYVGVPEITLPGLLTLPEVRFFTKQKQSGVAKLALVAIDNKTHQALGTGGITLAQSNDNNWFVFGMGPYREGNVKEEVTGNSGYRRGDVNQPLPRTVAFNSPLPMGEPGVSTNYATQTKDVESAGKAAIAAPAPAENTTDQDWAKDIN
jgi:hypothetical protein